MTQATQITTNVEDYIANQVLNVAATPVLITIAHLVMMTLKAGRLL